MRIPVQSMQTAANQIAKPLRVATEVFGRLGQGDLSARIDAGGDGVYQRLPGELP